MYIFNQCNDFIRNKIGRYTFFLKKVYHYLENIANESWNYALKLFGTLSFSTLLYSIENQLLHTIYNHFTTKYLKQWVNVSTKLTRSRYFASILNRRICNIDFPIVGRTSCAPKFGLIYVDTLTTLGKSCGRSNFNPPTLCKVLKWYP